jgi:hypothetical protein
MADQDFDDVFAAAVGEFRAAAMRQISQPGPTTAMRRARLRRRRRAAALSTALALLITLPVMGLALNRGDRRANMTSPITPTVTENVSPSPSLAPTTPGPSVSASPRPASTRPAVAPSTGGGKKCRPGGYISVPRVGPPTIVEVDAPAFLCPDAKLYFFWATYRVEDKDTLVLAASGRSYVDLDQLRRTITLPGFKDDVDNCTAAFIVLGREAIKNTLAWTAGKEGPNGGSPYSGNTQLIKYPYHYYCDPPA